MSEIYLNEKSKIMKILNEVWEDAYKEGKQAAYRERQYREAIDRYCKYLEDDLKQVRENEDK